MSGETEWIVKYVAHPDPYILDVPQHSFVHLEMTEVGLLPNLTFGRGVNVLQSAISRFSGEVCLI